MVLIESNCCFLAGFMVAVLIAGLPGTGRCGVLVEEQTFEMPERSNSTPPQPGIYGGRPASLGNIPYQVLLTFTNENGDESYCGGTIHSNTVVSTAAHFICTYNNGRQVHFTQLQVYAGATVAEKGQMRKVRHAIPHPSYKDEEGRLHYDVAVLILEKPLDWIRDKVQGIRLANFILPDGAPCEISGWGESETERSPQNLRKASVVLRSNKECSSLYSDFMGDRQTCAGGEGGKTACFGDSGGPLVCRGPASGYRFHYGVASYVKTYGCGKSPVVYSRTSYWKGWMEETINKYEKNYKDKDAQAWYIVNS